MIERMTNLIRPWNRTQAVADHSKFKVVKRMAELGLFRNICEIR